VARFYTIDSANAQLTLVRPLLERLREQREELIRLRDEALALKTAVEGTSAGGGLFDGADPNGERRRLKLRMQAIVDQMQAAVIQLDRWSVTLRDIQTGLVDFPALVNGRQIWLCWRLGEAEIAWWHELDAGFAGRKPLIELA
jgi:hypothetical protein